MNNRELEAKRILTRQKSGFLTQGPYPFTHTLSWSVGCGFGGTYCGKYCYAQTMPNWLYNREEGEQWGDAVIVKANAPQLLHHELEKADRPSLRIFMSSVTDPYQPIEKRVRMTRRLLNIFAGYDDLDLLVIQTRGSMVTDDIALLQQIPYVVVSMSIETDIPGLPYGPTAAQISNRFEALQQVAAAGIPAQLTVSPCLPYSTDFATRILQSGVQRIVVDTFVDGDGSGGKRTASSPFGDLADYNWRDADPAKALLATLRAQHEAVGWSVDGFGGIPPRATADSSYRA